MIQIVAAIALLIAGVAGAAAQDNPIVGRMQAFAAAYNAGDAQAIGTFYTEDGALLPPGGAILSGRPAIAGHYASAFKQGASNLRFRVLEIRQAGPETAVEIGETRVSAGKNEIDGRYLHVWVLQDGAWMLSRDIYHVVGVSQ
jgi:uncharacterized protein (TIGR02246 family)